MLLEGGNAAICKQNFPIVSVVVVTYNAAATLQVCLNSIYQQTYPAIEIVVIDGQSTDGTVAILEANNHHINYWRSEYDAGIYDAMNKSINHFNGNWIYFLGADDELLPDFSALAYELKDPDTIYYSNVLSNGKVFWGKVSFYHIAKYGIFHQAILYPEAVFKKYSYDTQYPVRADHVLNMQCANDKTFKLAYMDYVIANYNDQGFSNQVIDTQFEKDHVHLVFTNFNLLIWSRIAFWKLKEKYLRKKVTGKLTT